MRIIRRSLRGQSATGQSFTGSDETGICNQDQIGKGYAPKGQTPILTQTGQKFSTSMIAAVNNRGLMRFKLYKGALNMEIFIDFMKRRKRGLKGADSYAAFLRADWLYDHGMSSSMRLLGHPSAIFCMTPLM
jgi:DDE superfamily endonuclease